MSKMEFERRYIKKSGITSQFYHDNFLTLECHCGDKGCKGWACVSNNPQSIEVHKELYIKEG